MEISNPSYSKVSMELRKQYPITNSGSQIATIQPTKKGDKKKTIIANRLLMMEESFFQNKDEHYKSNLNELQQDLITTHNEANDVFLEKVRLSQERRDYELNRLRLYETYQITRVENECQSEVDKLNEEYDNYVKIIKDRLYEKLVKKIKLLKEDKVLKDLANVNNYSIDMDIINNKKGSNNIDRAVSNVMDDRNVLANSPRKRQLLMSDTGYTSNTSINANASKNNNNNTNNTNANNNNNNNFEIFSDTNRRSGRRTRNPMDSYYNTDSNLSSNDTGYASASTKRKRIQSARAAAASQQQPSARNNYSSSNDDANFFSDNNSLSEILFGKNYQNNPNGVQNGTLTTRASASSAVSSRTKNRHFSGIPSLPNEDISSDLLILETALQKTNVFQEIVFSAEPEKSSSSHNNQPGSSSKRR